MPLLTITEARDQCSIDTNDADTLLTAIIASAEDVAAAYLNRAIFASQASLDVAVSAIQTDMASAGAAYDAAVEAVELIESEYEAAAALSIAEKALADAEYNASRTLHGVVVNASILASVRLVVGHLWANRESVVIGDSAVEMPMGAIFLLRPYRRVMMP